MRRRARFVGRLAAIVGAALALSGCGDVLNSLFDTAAPTGVSASDGDYTDSILVSWSAPSLSSDKWEGYEVLRYEVDWGAGSATTTATSYMIDSVSKATEYMVTVTTYLSKGYGAAGSASDTGFAMDASPLIWHDGGESYSAGAGGTWYVTMLQKGFSYRFAFVSGTGSIEFYPFKTLDPCHATATDSAPIWKCDEDGTSNKFYVHITPSVSGAFTAQCDYGFGHF